MSNLIELSGDAEFQKSVESSNAPVVLNFWASWAEPCQQMNDVFKELSSKFPALNFVQVWFPIAPTGDLHVILCSSMYCRLKLKTFPMCLRSLRSNQYLLLSFSRSGDKNLIDNQIRDSPSLTPIFFPSAEQQDSQQGRRSQGCWAFKCSR